MLSDREEKTAGLGKFRLESLSDGIFAFAMTLLVLDLKIPIGHEGDLPQTLFGLWPKFLIYLVSFLVLSVFWVAHHGYSHFVKKTDRWYLWMNLLFLMVVVLVPFTTDLMGDYPHNPLAVMIYGININAISLTLYFQWAYATDKHRLVGGELEADVIAKGKRRILIGFVFYLCAILLALYNPALSLILYTIIPICYVFPSQIDSHWTHFHD
ncbi:MAG: DUF1211 domain-containing protein [Candidatus Omnitrophica bacterium]|nr:DUF1211 domain-containing protein [Candidatus Omnitrophota bacterium]